MSLGALGSGGMAVMDRPVLRKIKSTEMNGTEYNNRFASLNEGMRGLKCQHERL
jgi:hypothetical protein